MTNEHLQQRFSECNASQPPDVVNECWMRIYKHYRESHRHYHTLKHLSDLLVQLDQAKHLVQNLPVVTMAIFYHDIVYHPGSSENEERSAIIAEEDLQRLAWKERDMREAAAYIRSTKTHEPNSSVLNHSDLEIFLDIDLSVLGADWETYRTYSRNILREFGNNAMVKWGRKAFMEKFLANKHIYHTLYFRKKLEERARTNIQREINELLK